MNQQELKQLMNGRADERAGSRLLIDKIHSPPELKTVPSRDDGEFTQINRFY